MPMISTWNLVLYDYKLSLFQNPNAKNVHPLYSRKQFRMKHSFTRLHYFSSVDYFPAIAFLTEISLLKT